MDGDGEKLRNMGFEALPDPAGDVFAGGVFQAGDFVEEAVVELVFQGAEAGLDVGEIHHPAFEGIDGAFDGDFDAEGVAVEAGALVAGRDVGEGVGGFEGELLGEFDDEGAFGGSCGYCTAEMREGRQVVESSNRWEMRLRFGG